MRTHEEAKSKAWPARVGLGVVVAGLGLCLCLALVACGHSRPACKDLGPTLGASLTAANATQSMDSFNKAFLQASPGTAVYSHTNVDGAIDFWKEAEMIEMAEDYYRYTRDPAYKSLVADLCRGFVSRFGTDWMQLHEGGGKSGRHVGPRANDDVMWMIIASARACQITGDRSYARMAAANFTAAYTRSWSSDLGGGIWWRVATAHGYPPQKNTTTNATGAIAACELFHIFHRQSYLVQARTLYRWERTHLFDASSGQVYDRLLPTPGGSPVLKRGTYSYNQGTFIGAATLLHEITGERGYLHDANLALQYTRAHMTTRGILNSDGTRPGQDTGGFRGIFARWAVRFARDNRFTTYDAWFRRNAGAVWEHRDGNGLTCLDWLLPTRNGMHYAFDCSSAVAMMEALLPHRASTALW